MTSTLSYYDVVDANTLDDPVPFSLTGDSSFTDRDACFTWLWEHEESLRFAVMDEIINGVAVRETQVPALFLVVGSNSRRSKKEVLSYLGWGARVLGETEHFYIVGVPKEHASYISQRLGSGLYYVHTLNSLESARSLADSLESTLYK